MQTPSPTLRERHRARTAAEIHRAALDLVERRGYAESTVEAIAEAAGVSRRTFFNYYASKEDAVLGLLPVEVPTDALRRFQEDAAGDEFAGTVHLLLTVLRSASGAPELAPRRRALVEEHPEFKRRIGLHLSAAESLVATVVAENPAPGTEPRSPETSLAFVLLAAAVLKFAYRMNPHLAQALDDTSVDQAIEHALDVFRTAFKEIS